MHKNIPDNMIALARKIRLLILDVDGILTNGKIYITPQGDEIIQFHVHDGLGMKHLQQSGIEIAVISSRNIKAIAQRFPFLKEQHIFLGQENKLSAYQALLKQLNLTHEQVAYAGDDLPDEPIMKQVGLPITVPQAIDEIKAIARFQTTRKGGKGAVREICDFIYQAQHYSL